MADTPLIVAVGGGDSSLSAADAFLRAAGQGEGVAVLLLLQVIPPLTAEALTSHFAAVTPMPVGLADGVTPAPGHAYVVPHDAAVRVASGRLVLEAQGSDHGGRAPLDAFFRTVAEAYESRAAAVILGGAGSHGSMGLKRVKERGGVVVVQDPEESSGPEMPQHAMATGFADWVLPVSAIPARLASYWAQASRSTRAELADEHAEADQLALLDVFAHLRRHTGHDFSNYKRATVLRRLERRMGVHGVTTLAAYLQILESNTAENASLLKDLLISVTNFFRDPATFRALAEHIIPVIFDQTPPAQPIRAWVAGCATGEEAYSLAMLLVEHAERRSPNRTLQVFATDLDADAIAHARRGVYTAADVADVSAERLRAFFTSDAHGYRVRRDIRELVLFAEHNLLRDPPFLHMHLATCRNLLIYFNRTAQDRAIETLHFALAPRGYLVLGSSESIEEVSDLFTVADKEHHIYEARNVAPRMRTDLPDRGARLTDPARRPAEPEAARAAEAPWLWRGSTLELHQRLLDSHSGPSLVVNADHDVVHVSDRAARYLEFGGGEPSLNVLDLLRPELRVVVRTGLFRAARDGRSVASPGVLVRFGDASERVVVSVRPTLVAPELPGQFFVIVFDSIAAGAHASPVETLEAGEPSARALAEENRELRTQLRATREHLSSQAAEFESTNEELQATNEELRSTAEELQTSKEELGAVNEELHTLNEELKLRIDELSRANSDLQNLIAASEIGVVFLDRSLRVKLFTPAVRALFSLIPSDVGRPLEDISSVLPHDRLRSDAETVLATGAPVERDLRTPAGRHYLLRVVPYRLSGNRPDGLVLTFLDLTSLAHAGEALRQSEERFRLLSDSGLICIAFLDAEGVFTDANDALLALFGYGRHEVAEGALRLDRLTPPEWMGRTAAALEEFRATGRIPPFEREYLRRDGSRFWGLLGAARLEGRKEGVAFLIDVTTRSHPAPGRVSD